MLLKFLAAIAMSTALTTSAHGQTFAEVDSLIDDFVAVGHRSAWSPYKLFAGCPNLQSWQEYGFRRLASMELTRERENDLAASWMPVLRECGDRRLEQWYLARYDAAVRRGDVERMAGIWSALNRVDSPTIRAHFWNLLNDSNRPEDTRGRAGAMDFRRLTNQERVRDYLKLFEAERLPSGIDWSVAEFLMRDGHGRELMEGVGRLVRTNPALATQPGFGQVVSSSSGRVDQGYRDRLADALEAGLAAAPGRVTDAESRHLQALAAHLRRTSR